jgi:hypothetical protein
MNNEYAIREFIRQYDAENNARRDEKRDERLAHWRGTVYSGDVEFYDYEEDCRQARERALQAFQQCPVWGPGGRCDQLSAKAQ